MYSFLFELSADSNRKKMKMERIDRVKCGIDELSSSCWVQRYIGWGGGVTGNVQKTFYWKLWGPHFDLWPQLGRQWYTPLSLSRRVLFKNIYILSQKAFGTSWVSLSVHIFFLEFVISIFIHKMHNLSLTNKRARSKWTGKVYYRFHRFKPTCLKLTPNQFETRKIAFNNPRTTRQMHVKDR
jgi:hypothetical protein